MPKQSIDQMKCGQCGGESHTLFLCEGGQYNGAILVVCCGCKNKSYITIRPATLLVVGDDNSPGRITGGWS